MNADDRRRSADLLKNLIVEEKRSRWPKIFGVIVVLALAGGAAYWFYLPPDQRATLSSLQARLEPLAATVLNTPILAPAGAPVHAPASSSGQKPTPPTASGDTGLLSN